MLMFDVDDTIIAISSAAGAAARGIVRISGPEALSSLADIFAVDEGFDPRQAAGRSCLRGRCRLSEQIGCTAMVLIFRRPHSYTTQDMVELHLPGTPALLEMVQRELMRQGVRPAEPGEFTARAFLGGRIDLTEAEAVAEVINARSDSQLMAAEKLLDGQLHRSCRKLSSELAELLALVETGIDFSEEDIEFVSRQELIDRLTAARNLLRNILKESVSWKQLNHLPAVVVAGPPNAGKSSLVNALTGYPRSVVSAIAGATRDLLTVPLSLPHGECMLIDTAGLGETADPLAEHSRRLSYRALAEGELVLWVYDCAAGGEGDEAAVCKGISGKRVIRVGNKADRVKAAARRDSNDAEADMYISALRGDGLKELKERIDAALHLETGRYSEEAIALTIRQQEALLAAQSGLEQALELMGLPDESGVELIALELRDGLDKLGEISGEVVSEEVLGIIFRRFCVGK